MYAEWKLIAWRFIRTFVAAFLVQLAAILPSLEKVPPTIDLWYMLFLPAVTAGIVALSKAIRDKYGDDEYEDLVHKLPV